MQQFKFNTRVYNRGSNSLPNKFNAISYGYRGCLVNRTLSISVCMHPSDLSKDTSTPSLNYLISSILQTIIHVEHNVI